MKRFIAGGFYILFAIGCVRVVFWAAAAQAITGGR